MKNSCTYLRNGGLLVCAISVLLTAGCGDAPVQPKNKTSAIPKPASNAAKEANEELSRLFEADHEEMIEQHEADWN